jgi:hypothetical protein
VHFPPKLPRAVLSKQNSILSRSLVPQRYFRSQSRSTIHKKSTSIMFLHFYRHFDRRAVWVKQFFRLGFFSFPRNKQLPFSIGPLFCSFFRFSPVIDLPMSINFCPISIFRYIHDIFAILSPVLSFGSRHIADRTSSMAFRDAVTLKNWASSERVALEKSFP